jgi:hypothetical protein
MAQGPYHILWKSFILFIVEMESTHTQIGKKVIWRWQWLVGVIPFKSQRNRTLCKRVSKGVFRPGYFAYTHCVYTVQRFCLDPPGTFEIQFLNCQQKWQFIIHHYHMNMWPLCCVLLTRNCFGGRNLKWNRRVELDLKAILRIWASDFKCYYKLLGSSNYQMDTEYWNAIPQTVRLAVTLSCLATGDVFTSMMYMFKILKQSPSVIVPEVCEAWIHAPK